MKPHILVVMSLGIFAAGTSAALAQSVCPDNFEAFAGTAEPLACNCTAEAVQVGIDKELMYPVYGMDIYAAGSPICLSAVHAGVIGKEGGPVTVIPEAGRDAYAGVTRNGVASRNAGKEAGSFRFEMAGAPATPPAAAAEPSPAPPAATAASVCPDNFEAFADTTDPLACNCTAESIQTAADNQLKYPVYGMDIYTAGSPICLAAMHAGIIGKEGGAVTVIPEAGRNAYAGVTRNGIVSRNAKKEEASFRFELATAAAATGGTAPAAVTAVSVCPDNFEAFAGTTEPLNCNCTEESVQVGADNQLKYPVYGMDIYTAGSPICLSAVHAGAIAMEGGAVTVVPEPGRDAYPGVTRNGVESRNAKKEDSSFRFEIAATAPAASEPVQQPIAETIAQTGEVQLYVRFEFNSAELDPSAEPTLTELRDTLESSPQLRLALIGHTDAIGSSDYNRDLSLRRARSVMRWLIDHGITETRLSADGKGFDEPIANNDTESGRAQNRRVQALRIE